MCKAASAAGIHHKRAAHHVSIHKGNIEDNIRAIVGIKRVRSKYCLERERDELLKLMGIKRARIHTYNAAV